MKKSAGAIVMVVVLLTMGAAVGGQFAKPFPGQYAMLGDPTRLLDGDKISLQIYASPECAQCYLFHREMKGTFGDDVAVQRSYVFHGEDGKAPVRLLLLARLVSAEKEDELLAALFDANFVKKAPIEDAQVLAALATAHGLGEAWADPAMQKKVDAEIAKLEKEFEERGGAPKTPLLVVNGVLAMSPGWSKANGDELPAIVLKVLDEVRTYRHEHGK